MILAAEGAFIWWDWIGQNVEALSFLHDLPPTLVAGYVGAIVLSVLAFLAGKKYRDVEKGLVPDAGLTLSSVMDLLAEGFVFNLSETVMGKKARKWAWLIGGLFFYILIGNLMGLVPSFASPTASMNANLAMGLVVFLLYHAAGFKEHGAGYARHFWAPPGLPLWIAPFVGLLLAGIELLSHAARPFSLSLRLYGNIEGGHMVLNAFTGLIPLLVPVLFMAFELLVAFIQAFVFTILSVVYFAMATAHDH